jgi:hypothetical protein
VQLFHVTTRRAFRAIRKDRCLDPLFATGRMEATWFVPVVKVDWAILTVQARHLARLADIVILEFDLEDGEVSEHAGSYKFFRKERTPLGRCVSIKTAGEWVDREQADSAGMLAGLVAG